MSIEVEALFAVTGAVALIAAGGCWTLRRRLSDAAIEAESLRDAVWAAQEREERARTEGVRAVESAKQRAAAVSEAKTRFLATVTHEMRTPLSGVIGATDLLLGTPLAAEQRTYATAVKISAEGMLALVDEMLDLSSIESDRVALQTAPFDVAEVVEGVAELLAPRAQAKGLDLAVRVAVEGPAMVVGDAARVRQILLNLAGNAVKFTAAGGVGLRVDPTGDGLRFTVLDTGPGFEPSDAERLFEEFERGDADPGAGGAGLGLAISARLAAAMGGRLTADGRPGEGAVFTLTLPAAAAAPAPQPEASLAGRRLLVVSHAPFGGPWLVEKLSEWGAEARLVAPEPADEFAARVRRFKADTVVIDRAIEARASDLAAAARLGGAEKTLALLTPLDRRELPALVADGFDGYLVKPVRAASLTSRLNDPRPLGGQVPVETRPAVSFPQTRGLKVLLAEDDPVSALIAVAHLSRLGHAVVRVEDGLEAVAAFEAETFDAALVDVRMPGLDGLACARRLREIERAGDRRPALVVALTANVSTADRAAALEAGMDDLLAKPLDARALEGLLAVQAAVAARVA
ncbi:ATP-binding protein [Methylopila sp. 73B]|uniref:ATP-binding protein n=1 Tax=Methylopila sp. 73B TaxID=1120792 RepID=UPI0003722DE6|nr:ATP-binding protein [Methylopila sp. 73B]